VPKCWKEIHQQDLAWWYWMLVHFLIFNCQWCDRRKPNWWYVRAWDTPNIILQLIYVQLQFAWHRSLNTEKLKKILHLTLKFEFVRYFLHRPRHWKNECIVITSLHIVNTIIVHGYTSYKHEPILHLWQECLDFFLVESTNSDARFFFLSSWLLVWYQSISISPSGEAYFSTDAFNKCVSLINVSLQKLQIFQV
jgi:hypothetical protein